MAEKGDLTIEFQFRNKRFQDAAGGLRRFAEVFQGDWDGTPKILSNELRDYLDTVAAALMMRHGADWPGGTTPTTMSKRSGNAMQSVIESVRVEGDTFQNIVGYIGGAFPLSVHEFGKTIHMKNHLLTIPLPAALDSKGIPLKKSAREWSKTFVAKSKKGNLIIFQKQEGKIVPLYVLKTQVTIPARLGMGDTLKTNLPYFVDKSMNAMVAALIAKAQL